MEVEAPKESAAEIIRKKFKQLTISQETKELVSDLSLSSEEMNDERTKYILGYKEPGKNLQGTREESPRN